MKRTSRFLLAVSTGVLLAGVALAYPPGYRPAYRPPAYRPSYRPPVYHPPPRVEPRTLPHEMPRHTYDPFRPGHDSSRPGYDPYRPGYDPVRPGVGLGRPAADPYSELYAPYRQRRTPLDVLAEQQRKAQDAARSAVQAKAQTDPVGALRELYGWTGAMSRLSSSPEWREQVAGQAVAQVRKRAKEVLEEPSFSFVLPGGSRRTRRILLEPSSPLEDRWTSLARTRALREEVGQARGLVLGKTVPGAEELAQVHVDLTARETVLKQACLEASLAEVAGLAERGDWKGAGRRAQEFLGKLGDGDNPRSLTDFVGLAERLEALAPVGHALEQPPGKRNAGLEGVDTQALPASLRDSVRDLLGLLRLGDTLETPWKAAPDVDQVVAQVEALGRRSGDTPLIRRLSQELAVKAFLEGYPEQAQRLLEASATALKDRPPSPREKKATDALLRDLGAALAEGGPIETWVVQQAVADNPGRTGHPTRGPPAGLALLLPEGERAGWRPPVQADPRDDLPPLPEALRPVIQKHHEKTRSDYQREEQAASDCKQAILQQARKPSDPAPSFAPLPYRARPISPVASSPGGNAGTAEGETAEDVRFIAEVERLLGRKLTDAERRTARLYRRQGKTATEAFIAFALSR